MPRHDDVAAEVRVCESVGQLSIVVNSESRNIRAQTVTAMFWRFFGTYSLLLLAAIGLLGGVVLARVERYSLEQIEESLRTKAVLIGEALRGPPGGVGSGL